MSRWILLGLTVFCLFLTLDAFHWKSPVKRPPAMKGPALWNRNFHAASPAQQREILRRYASSYVGLGALAWLFLAMTVLLGILTAYAFLE